MSAGHAPAAPDRADLLIVNTCGFIDAAKEESIDAILDAVDAATSRGAHVAAVGCLVQRYRDQLPRALSEVDLFCGFEVDPVCALLDGLGRATAADGGRQATRRPRPLHAYLKVSDGCDRRCAFCAVPLIKGAYETTSPGEVLAAAGAALERGARELVLVGQDTSHWTWPGYGGLERLLSDLAGLGPLWLRVLYLQPDGVDDRLLQGLAQHAVPYVDIPLQHASRTVLRAMGRGGDGDAYLALLARVRSALPGVAVRSTFITGFPGETEADFDELLAFVETAGIAVGGVFAFDPQEGTPAAALLGRVPVTLAEERAARLAAALERAARDFWDGLVGKEVDVLVERGSRGGGREAIGRIAFQAPDVDGVIAVADARVRRGEVIRAVVDSAAGYDLQATAIGKAMTTASRPE